MKGSEGFASRLTVILNGMTLKCFVFILITNISLSQSYPLFGGKRYLRTMPIRRSYFSIPVSRLHNEYPLSEYEKAYVPTTQNDYEYNAYDKHPYVQYLGYYPSGNFYSELPLRRSLESYEYFDDLLPQEDVQEDVDRQEKSDMYPYGQETWYEEDLSRFDRNSEANKAFLQNLIMAQMFQDAKNQYPYGYESTSDDYDDQHWFYGVPTTEVDDKEKVKQYFKNKEDEEVLELESLARKKGKSKKLKLKENYRKQKNSGVVEKPTKSKSKMTDDEYFDMQKQLIVNSRKKGLFAGAVANSDDLRFSKKQDPDEVKGNFWSFYKPQKFNLDPLNALNNVNLMNEEKNAEDYSESNINVESTATTTAGAGTATSRTSQGSIPTKRPAVVGQKEVVLPRPSNPARRPYSDVSSRTLHHPSVYDTIKRLLNMEKQLQKEEMSQPQKRFVLNEDQLTEELSGLKKKAA